MQASLAALFAARCTPDRWSAHVTSKAAWLFLRQFAEFLARQPQPPRDLDELTPELVGEWRQSLTGLLGGITRSSGRAAFCAMTPASGRPVADELARRHKPRPQQGPVLQRGRVDQITTAARRRFRAALQRINDNALHLQRWREGAFAEDSRDWVIGEGLDILARTGDLPRYTDKNGQRTSRAGTATRSAGRRARVTWQRLFLTRMEAAALGVLLMAEFGWNLSVISRLEVPRASPDPGRGRPPDLPHTAGEAPPRPRPPLRDPQRHRLRGRLAGTADHSGPAGHALRPRHRRGAGSRHQSPDRLAGLQRRPLPRRLGPPPSSRPVPLRRRPERRDRTGAKPRGWAAAPSGGAAGQ